MITENISFIAFLLTAVLGLSSTVWWLMKKVLSLTKECTETMNNVRTAVEHNTEALKELKQTLILNHK